MGAELKLAATALLPVIFSALLYFLDKKTQFGGLDKRLKQTVYGVLFGVLSIFGSEFGTVVLGVTMNVRDAAPICAGLIFGAPAGILSGIIGAVERYIAAPWSGEYTKVACTVATLFAGFFAAWLRKYMFEDRKPAWYYGLATGVITEVVHMILVFLTNINDARRAFDVVEKCTVPMVVLNGVSVMLALLAVAYISREKSRKRKAGISQTFQRYLLICIIIAFGATSTFTFFLQSGVAFNESDNLLKLNIEDVRADIMNASDENLLRLTRNMASTLERLGDTDSETLGKYCRLYDVAEINIFDENGIITATSYPDFLGFDMKSGEQSAEFLVLLDGNVKEYVQEYRATTYDASIFRKYAGLRLADGSVLQVAYDAEHFQKQIDDDIITAVRNRHVGENGFMIICNKNFEIVSSGIRLDSETMKTQDKRSDLREGKTFVSSLGKEDYYSMYGTAEGYYIVALIPKPDVLFSRNLPVYITIYMEVLVFTVLFVLVYFLIKKLIVDNIRKINGSLAQITSGNLDVTVDVRENEEFASLSDDINATVDTLKHYIDEAAARIDKELEFARAIQKSALPNVFPPYPSRTEFDIYACMATAKEVGGDFYDFYMLGDNRLAFVIADVSGKGIPAAMFMMTAKTVIKSLAEAGAEVDEVFTRSNEKLCDGNEAGMFVTAWMGVIDLETGNVKCVNAGHNPPLLKKKDGSFAYLKVRAGLVLAGLDGVRYRTNEFTMSPGDTLFLYTDGVTEATDASKQLYGEDRLERFLNSIYIGSAEKLCKNVKADVDRFVADEPQFDDITMLCLRYHGKNAEGQG